VSYPVVRGVRYFMAHTPGLVRHGSKPAREIPKQSDLLERLRAHYRSYEDALAYPPNRVFLGAMAPEELAAFPTPWWRAGTCRERWLPYGELMPGEELYGLLRAFDQFDLIWLEDGFLAEARERLRSHRYVTPADLARLEQGHPRTAIEAQVDSGAAIPLELSDGTMVGCCNRAHDEDATLGADVLLENLACVATAAMATRTLLDQCRVDPAGVDYVFGSGEEAIGDRYQRGGGNLAKAVAERCGLLDATGSDVKAFCCGPNHALAIAGGLVQAGVFHQILVVGGCSLAKLGMKALGHLARDMPVLEDVLAGFAIHIGPDDGASPRLRTDALGRHSVRAKSSQQAIIEALVVEPLGRLGMRLSDVDKYATELHNPEVTEPAGSGNVPMTNYRMIAALAVQRGEIAPGEIPAWIAAHGMPGFAPTQGHVASAVPYLGHALDAMRRGTLRNALFMAKGSLFLGRMTQMADGLSFLLERNDGARA